MLEVSRRLNQDAAEPQREGSPIMKKKIAAMALCGCLAGGHAGAQSPVYGPTDPPQMPATPSYTSPASEASATPPPGSQRVYRANSNLPGPTPDDQLRQSSIPLPDDPLEPYLLTKANGPFMVLAKVFRGPESERMALALCKELREDFHMPAYILRSKEFPMKSYIRGTPVQAPSMTMKSAIKQPEQVRIHDEAAVLVGDEKTLAASEVLLNKVKALHPKCLDKMPALFKWREGGGLARAIRTTNPYVPSQWLYPRAPDRLVVKLNSGLRSIANNPGHYTLQVAQFNGRTAYDLNGERGSLVQGMIDPKSSPLRTAHDDAERLADKLARSPEIKTIGQPVFVYHDRTSSRVFIGAFNSDKDPAIVPVHAELLKAAGKLNAKDKRGRAAVDQMIVPATYLTDVDEIKTNLK
jgi:hypothetical protein